MNNILLMCVLAFGVVAYSSLINAQQADSSSIGAPSKTVNVVNHNQHFLVIDDFLYYMRINTKVYIYDGKNKPLRKVNRYALKSGQSVTIQTSGTHEKEYVDTLLIHNDI